MLLNEIKPSACLTEYIRLYRIIDFQFSGAAPVPFKAYPPRPEHCLQFMVHDPETVTYPGSGLRICRQKAIFMGPHSNVIHRYPGRRTLGLQVIFQPGAIHQITNISCHELTNLYTEADDVFGISTALVNEQLFHSKNYTEMIGVAEEFLTTLIKIKRHKKHPVDEISKAMIYEDETFALDKFLKAACLSHRQVDRKFRERVGMAPKQFLQISRFDKAFRMKNRFPKKDWLSIALHCGYYDYQHLVKDYKEFTGYTPTQFFDIDSGAPERSLGDVEI
jgi:AraC-like DNA-binding protein